MKKLIIMANKILVFIMLLPLLTLAQSKNVSEIVLTTGNDQGQISEHFPTTRTNRDITEDSVWMHYDDVENFDSWGFLISGEIYDIVAKWDPDSLVNYNGFAVTKVKFIVVNDIPILKVKVWEGPDFTEIYSQDVPTYNVNTWTEVVLDSAVVFDITKELYVGYNVDMSSTELGGFVTATDDGPAVDGYGNLCRLNDTWLTDFYNHNLRVLIEDFLVADFTSDVTNVCQGSSVNFTDNSNGSPVSWNWSFEGGTPTTSTQQNPSITYNSTGTYDVQLIIGNSSGPFDTIVKEDYIEVVVLAASPNTPNGETEICNDESTDYWTTEVQYANWYEWSVNPADAGSIIGDGITVSFTASEIWTGNYTVKVRAVNVCGNSNWSGELDCILNAKPTEFNLSEGGDACEGGDGVEITLDGSETGVDYYLHYDGDTVAGPLAGTGSEISFGFFTDGGYYSSTAFNGSCSEFMIGDAQITETLLPEVTGTPTGPETICSESISEYEIEEVEGAISYVWTIIPEEAGTIEGASLTGTVTWDASYEGTAEIASRGENDCGAGPSGPSLEVMVYAEPMPEITGDNLVCQQDFGTYTVAYSEYSEYNWTLSGGNITEGQGTNEITVYWIAEQGSVNPVNVTETKTDACEGVAETFDVTIDQCVGINELNENEFVVYPNPANDEIKIKLTNTFASTIEVQIINSKGKLVYADKHLLVNGSLKTNINTSKMNAGIYVLTVRTNNDIISHKKLVLVK